MHILGKEHTKHVARQTDDPTLTIDPHKYVFTSIVNASLCFFHSANPHLLLVTDGLWCLISFIGLLLEIYSDAESFTAASCRGRIV